MVDLAYFLAVFLVFLRISSYFYTMGKFFPSQTPLIFRNGLCLIISYGLVGSIDYIELLKLDSNYLLIFYAISEIMTGLILGYITNLIFEVVKFAGGWMDVHAGFSMVNVLDPSTQTSSTLLSNLSYFISLVFFFLINGHHIVIRLIHESIKIVPIGRTIVYQETIGGVIETITEFFTLGVKIALPVVIIILLTDVCLGLISRTVPSIPIMIFGMPIKNILGFVTYILVLPIILKAISNAVYNLPSLFDRIFNLIPAIPLVFIFAGDDKTEEATPKKKSDARKKGQIAKSKDVSVAITMVTCTIIISTLFDSIVKSFKEVIIYYLQLPLFDTFDKNSLHNFIITAVIKIAMILLPIALPIMISGVAANLMQTGFLITGEPLKPSFGKLNPLSGIKNMFSKKSLVDLMKNLVVITIVSIIAYKYINSNYSKILSMHNIYLPTLSLEVKEIVVGVFKQITLVLVIIAAIDYFLQTKIHDKELKMSKQEVKEEFKQQEGDPQLKGKIKQKQREMSRQRMMSSVADATVVITNPTHLAIALRYEEDSEEMEAPRVVAKGADYLALSIKSLAKENNVPIIENKPLARLMYDKVEIEDEIPPDLYQGVAEILAVVIKLKNN